MLDAWLRANLAVRGDPIHGARKMRARSGGRLCYAARLMAQAASEPGTRYDSGRAMMAGVLSLLAASMQGTVRSMSSSRLARRGIDCRLAVADGPTVSVQGDTVARSAKQAFVPPSSH